MKGTLNYKIRELKSGKASIQIVHSFGRGKEVRYSTGQSIDSPDYWNENKQRVRNLTVQKNANLINSFLNKKLPQIEDGLKKLFFENPNYDKKEVKALFDEVFGKSKKVDRSIPTLIECYKWYYEHFAVNPNPVTKKPLADGTLRSLKTSYKIFEIYSKKCGGINYEDISMDFYDEFLTYLRSKEFSNNYISNHIKNLKTILNYSLSRGYHNNLTHKRREFAKPKESVDSIYLSLDELKKLENLKLTKSQEVSRDLFLIGAYTGLRVSDFNRLSKENLEFLEGKYYFKIESQKTSQPLLIPCHPVTLEIIKKYGFAPPPRKPDQHINKDLKIIGAEAKFNEDVVITKTIGGKKKTFNYKKYQLLTTHTARRSFCTNAYKSGMPTLDIMTISGHQTEKVFYDYIKASSFERAKRIGDHPFFNK
tara:strand:+ start:57748 stop:59013 length:1266 start_codon:yes stop_codon:yes gene_type:complete